MSHLVCFFPKSQPLISNVCTISPFSLPFHEICITQLCLLPLCQPFSDAVDLSVRLLVFTFGFFTPPWQPMPRWLIFWSEKTMPRQLDTPYKAGTLQKEIGPHFSFFFFNLSYLSAFGQFLNVSHIFHLKSHSVLGSFYGVIDGILFICGFNVSSALCSIKIFS